MPLMPKRVKHRKVQRGVIKGKASSNNSLNFGDYGLQTEEIGRITSQQIEAARTAITRHMKRRGKLWIKIFPDKPFTKKPLELPDEADYEPFESDDLDDGTGDEAPEEPTDQEQTGENGEDGNGGEDNGDNGGGVWHGRLRE